jgi:hypothetical protein
MEYNEKKTYFSILPGQWESIENFALIELDQHHLAKI